MIVYNVGDRIKVKESAKVIHSRLEKGTVGIVVALHEGRVEAAFEGLGLISVSHDLIKKKTRKVEQLVKAKNLKLSDEIALPGFGEYDQIGGINRDEYILGTTSISVETINYDSHIYEYNELVKVRR